MDTKEPTEAEIEAMMEAQMAAEMEVEVEVAGPAPAATASATFPEFTPNALAGGGVDLSALMDLHLPCYFELGATRLSISELLTLTRGSVVLLDRMVGEPGKFVVAGKEFAQGEVVALEGGYYGIRITNVIASLGGREGTS